MDFRLDADHAELQELVREFAVKEIAPKAAMRDEEERFDAEAFAKIAEIGLTGIPWPEAYGGAGMDYLAFVIAVEELSRVCGATGADLAIHTALASWPIYTYGTEEHKQRYLRRLATGETLGSFGLTESTAGSDTGSMRTSATRDGDSYVLNGAKVFTSNAGIAEIYIVFALTNPTERENGISAFIVEKGTPGFEIGRAERKMGIRGHVVASLHFDNCRIPEANRLGTEGQGYQIAKTALYGGRLAISAQALGLAEGAFEQARNYAKGRQQFGRALDEFQATQFKLADMATQIEAARLMVYQAAWLQSRGLPYAKFTAMCKVFVPEMAMRLTTEAVQILGGYGFTRDFPVERMMRDAKITAIYTGTVEMQRIEIAQYIDEDSRALTTA